MVSNSLLIFNEVELAAFCGFITFFVVHCPCPAPLFFGGGWRMKGIRWFPYLYTVRPLSVSSICVCVGKLKPLARLVADHGKESLWTVITS